MIIAFKSAPLTRTLIGSTALAVIMALSLLRPAMAEERPVPGAADVTTTAPAGWWKNGSKPAAYVVGVDRVKIHGGLPSAYVKSIEPAIDGFGGMMQMCSAENYRGKRLRFSAWMSTAEAKDGGGHLWLRVDGPEPDATLQFDNLDNRPVKGTTDWQEYSLVLDVPANASALAYGFFIGGTGQAWVSTARIEEVGQDVPTTDLLKKKPGLPKSPVNLTFE